MTRFNPLSYIQQLQEAGVPEKQARIQAEGLLAVADGGFATKDDLKTFATKDDLKNFATKDDLKNLEQRLDGRINHLEQQLNGRIDHLEQQLNGKINMVEAVLTTKINSVDTKLSWLMTLMGAIGAMLAILNFLHIH